MQHAAIQTVVAWHRDASLHGEPGQPPPCLHYLVVTPEQLEVAGVPAHVPDLGLTPTPMVGPLPPLGDRDVGEDKRHADELLLARLIQLVTPELGSNVGIEDDTRLPRRHGCGYEARRLRCSIARNSSNSSSESQGPPSPSSLSISAVNGLPRSEGLALVRCFSRLRNRRSGLNAAADSSRCAPRATVLSLGAASVASVHCDTSAKANKWLGPSKWINPTVRLDRIAPNVLQESRSAVAILGTGGSG
jgi:hypothetical protein